MNGKGPASRRESLKSILRAMLRGLVHNGGFKLLALVIAIVLWAGLIAQDPTLTREKAFDNVTVNITGSEAIKRNGFIVVSDLAAGLQGVSMRANVPQMQYQTVQPSYYNARVDLSRVTEAGVQEATILTTNSTTYGMVTEVEPATVQLEVEEYITRYRIPVSVEVVGSAPEGFYAAAPNQDPPVVTISGPRSLVEKVVRVKAVIDQSTLPQREGLVRTAVPFRLVDSLGETVESHLLEVTNESSVLLDSVVVEQQLYAVRTLDLNDLGLVVGTPAEGYEIKSVSITPERVTVAGKRESIELLDSLFAQGSVDVTDLTESINEHLRLRRPSELAYTSTDSVTVAVEIGPVIRSRTFEDVKVEVTGTGEGLSAKQAVSRAQVTVSGAQLWVQSLKSGYLTLMCDASGLAAGTYQLPVVCQVRDSEGLTFSVEVLPETIEVTISER